jgi:hypothetical protein
MKGILAAVSIVLAPDASEPEKVIIDDAGEFRVDVGALRPCVAYPEELRRAEACRRFEPYAPQVPSPTREMRVFAMGRFPLSNGDHAGLVLMKITGVPRTFATDADVEAYMQGFARDAQSSEPGSTARSSGGRLVQIADGTNAARGSTDLDGLPASKEGAAHRTRLVVPTRDGSYIVSLVGRQSASAEIDAALDSISSSALATHRPDQARSEPVTIRDGAELSVDVTSLHACIVHPRALRDDASCAGLQPDAVNVPKDTSDTRTVAISVIRFGDGALGAFGVGFIRGRPDEPTSDDDAAKVMGSATEEFRKTIPPDAKVRSEPVQLVRVAHGAAAVRARYDIDNLAPALAVMEHMTMLMVPTAKGTYVVTLGGPRGHAAEIDAALERLMPSLMVASPAHGHDVSAELGKSLAKLLLPLVIGLACYIAHRRAKKRTLEQQKWAESERETLDRYGPNPPR